MTYKGYIGSVNYSDKDQVFFGKIEGINGLVNFEGESVKELTTAFHEAVDDDLAYCEDEGIEPDKSYTGVLNVRLTPSIHPTSWHIHQCLHQGRTGGKGRESRSGLIHL